MVTNNTLSSIVDDHTRKIDVIRRDLVQLNTTINAQMDRLKTFMNIMTVMQTQIKKLTTIM